MKKALAVFVTLVAVLMTAVAAWDRGGTLLDKALLIALCVVIVLGVHLIPALSRLPVAWLVWFGCLFCAIYGHITFLTHASLRAGEIRAQQSALTVATERQIETIRESLSEIKARPVAVVAAELAQEHASRTRSALRTEIVEGKRAESLHDELARLEAISTTAQVDGATDPVTARIAAVTGGTESTVTVTISMLFALLLELVGALLWVEALHPNLAKVASVTGVTEAATNVTTVENKGVTEAVTDAVTPVATPTTEPELAKVMEAVKVGSCRATVTGIRAFLGCSQGRAIELRRLLVGMKMIPA